MDHLGLVACFGHAGHQFQGDVMEKAGAAACQAPRCFRIQQVALQGQQILQSPEYDMMDRVNLHWLASPILLCDSFP